MLKYIDEILKKFEGCFKRKEAFIWFVTITFGIIVRSDLMGITSIVGVLRIKADSYFNALHFFRATQIFTFIGCIALGILMLISENLPKSVWQNFSGWLRTVSSDSPSVETTRVAVQNAFNRNFRKVAVYKTLGLIQIHQREDTEESVDIAEDSCYSETG